MNNGGYRAIKDQKAQKLVDLGRALFVTKTEYDAAMPKAITSKAPTVYIKMNSSFRKVPTNKAQKLMSLGRAETATALQHEAHMYGVPTNLSEAAMRNMIETRKAEAASLPKPPKRIRNPRV